MFVEEFLVNISSNANHAVLVYYTKSLVFLENTSSCNNYTDDWITSMHPGVWQCRYISMESNLFIDSHNRIKLFTYVYIEKTSGFKGTVYAVLIQNPMSFSGYMQPQRLLVFVEPPVIIFLVASNFGSSTHFHCLYCTFIA